MSGGSEEETVAHAPVDPSTCTPETKVVVTDEDFIIGDKNAPVTLVEYLSQTCSHCAEFRATEIPKIEETFVQSGKVRIVFRELHRNNVDVAASALGAASAVRASCRSRTCCLPTSAHG
jgi:hypothetical protein